MNHSTNFEWVTETLTPDAITQYQVREVLGREDTPFQSMQLVDTVRYGRMLLLDGVVQTTEKDEFIYHEMMTHVPLCSHPAPRRVLIIGGGDGGILREVLRHPDVEEAVMVEIDGRVIDFCRKYLPTISNGAFDDPRAAIVIDDGAKYVKGSHDPFDVCIVDSPDPIGPARVLFQKDFYGNIARLLTDQGIFVRQTGSTFVQPAEQKETLQILREIYPFNALYVYAVPTYVGGFFSSSFSSRKIDPATVPAELIHKRFSKLVPGTSYYNPGLHLAAFQLPEYVKGNLAT